MLGTRSSLTLCMRWGLRAVVACCAYRLLAPVPSVLPFPGGDLRGPGQARPHAEPGRTWALSLPLHGPQVPLQEDSALHACDPTPAGSLNNGAGPKAALRRLSRAETRSDRVWEAWLVGSWGFGCPSLLFLLKVTGPFVSLGGPPPPSCAA